MAGEFLAKSITTLQVKAGKEHKNMVSHHSPLVLSDDCPVIGYPMSRGNFWKNKYQKYLSNEWMNEWMNW